jgi:hypothetical protein
MRKLHIYLEKLDEAEKVFKVHRLFCIINIGFLGENSLYQTMAESAKTYYQY